MTGSLGGVLVLFGLGAAFLIAGALGVVARRLGDRNWRPGRLAITVDLLVGVVGIGEAVIGVGEVSPHAVLWSPAAALVLVAVGLLVVSRVLWTLPLPVSDSARSASGPA